MNVNIQSISSLIPATGMRSCGHWVHRTHTLVLNPPGTDVMILKLFSPKNSAKKLAFLTLNKAKF
jgi:hypothetical protein